MTPNPILINSTNIIQFGLGITFDIGANTITFDSSAFTEYQSGGAANVQGIYLQVFDASGLEVKPHDLTTPDIIPSAPVPYVVQLPNGFAQYGMFIINAIIVDADGTQYPINLRKNICQPNNFSNNVVAGQFIAQVDCDTPRIILSETTNFTYQGLPPLTISKNGNLYYPQGTLDSIPFDFTPFEIAGNGNVYTGPYRIKNITTALYDLEDNVSVKINYYTLLDFNVACGSKLTNLLCCVDEVYATYNTDPNSNRGRDAKVKIEKITVPFINAVIKDKAGQNCDDEISTISKILQCNCACDPQSVEPLLLNAQNAGPSFTIVGQYGTTVVMDVIGSSKQYTVKSNSYFVTKDSGETGFSIQTISSAGVISYKIIINYSALTANILSTIGNSTELTEQLNALINAASGLSLAGLNGDCVISIATCNYRLIESITPVKTINSITIDGTTHNAPGGLLLTNTSGIATWLNGLSLGTFTANLDSGSNNVIIESDANTHIITQLAISTTAGSVIRQFTAVCTTLVDVLNAIITYLCDIDATKVAFGVASQAICTYDGDGNVLTTAVDPTIKLGALISNILNAQCALYGKISNIALNCSNLKTLLTTNSLTFLPDDGLFGTRGDACAKISWIDAATQFLSTINDTPALQAALCALTAQCSTPNCPAPANVSAVLTSGTLTVNANNVAGVTSVTIRYRLNNSGNTYNEVTIAPGALPYNITGLGDGQYEVGIQSLCSNGALSQWTTNVSQPCLPPISFGVILSGANFAVSANLAGTQTKIEVQMTDPNGGVTTTIHDFGTGVYGGTFNITVPTGIYGNYSFIARGVCDDTSSPRFVSAFTSPVNVTNSATPGANFSAIAFYGYEITSIVNGSATGVPAGFATMTLINATQSYYTPAVTAGTIMVTLVALSPPPHLKLQLIVNGSTVVSSVDITAGGTFTLTLPTGITAPTAISVQLNTPSS